MQFITRNFVESASLQWFKDTSSQSCRLATKKTEGSWSVRQVRRRFPHPSDDNCCQSVTRVCQQQKQALWKDWLMSDCWMKTMMKSMKLFHSNHYAHILKFFSDKLQQHRLVHVIVRLLKEKKNISVNFFCYSSMFFRLSLTCVFLLLFQLLVYYYWFHILRETDTTGPPAPLPPVSS